jgi:dienelactone hydrolase
MKNMLAILLVLCIGSTAMGEVVTETVNYSHGDVELEGFFAWDKSQQGKRPGVLVVHEWMGLNDYAKKRCRQLAEMGYVAFAVDMYGKGVRPQNREEASTQATIYRSDRDLMRDRVTAGLKVLLGNEFCEKNKVAAIGYCFGGGTALELARSGADISGVISFHGNLDTPDPEIAKNITCKVLVCHGADDPYVSQESIDGFYKEMKKAKVDYQLIAYSGAVHAFTNPSYGSDPSKGAAYNASADRRSWEHMKTFFNELFR